MKTNFKLFYLFYFLTAILNASFSQHVQWGLNINGSPDQKGLLMVADQSHNLYLSGNFEGTIDFDPGIGVSNLSANGPSDIFIMKLSASGDFLWVKQIGGVDFEKVNDIAIDNDGNLLLTGYFYQSVDFNPDLAVSEMVSVGANDVFLLKLNPDGDYIWAKQYGSISSDFGNSIALNSMNEIILTGQFDGTLSFQNESITSNGGADIFIAKLDSIGNCIWGQSLGGSFWDAGFFVTIDSTDAIYISGVFGGVVDFDFSVTESLLNADGMLNTFLLKLDSSGNFLFANNIGEDGTEFPTSINIDSQNNFYLAGYFDLGLDIDPSPNTIYLTPNGANDSYIAKFDSNGNLIWAKSLGGTGDDYVFSTMLNSEGRLYIFGSFQQSMDVNLTTGVSTLVSSGESDIFLMSCDSNGNFIQAGKMGSSFNDEGYNIIVDEIDNLYLSGLFTDTVDFDWEVGESPLVSGDVNDIFIVKLSQKPSPPSEIIGGDSICENTVTTFSTNLISGASNYHWIASQGIEILNGQGTESIQVTGQNQNGIIGLYVENSYGFSDTIYQTFDIIPIPQITITADPGDTITSGSSLTLYASGADSFQWTENIQNGIPFYPLETQTYWVTGIQGMCSSMDSIRIYVNTLGVTETLKNTNNPSLYSNGNQLFVNNCSTISNYTIYDLSGKQIINNLNYQSSSPINISYLAEGHYFIQLNDYFLRFSVIK